VDTEFGVVLAGVPSPVVSAFVVPGDTGEGLVVNFSDRVGGRVALEFLRLHKRSPGTNFTFTGSDFDINEEVHEFHPPSVVPAVLLILIVLFFNPVDEHHLGESDIEDVEVRSDTKEEEQHTIVLGIAEGNSCVDIGHGVSLLNPVHSLVELHELGPGDG
jgi:hypothetical protein